MSQFSYQEPQGGTTTVEFELRDGLLEVDGESTACDEHAVWLHGRRVPFAVTKNGDQINVWLDGEVYSFFQHDPRQRASSRNHAGTASGSVSAQMPGKILSLAVAPGDTVSAGQNLLIMESMKMELALNAPVDGTVESVAVTPGQLVAQGELLVRFASSEH